ncbi:hypothetical protein OXX59_003175 [Metschnikowia pulcherrima]
MKLTIFALLSAVALALTTNTPTQDNTSILNESDIPEGFPRNVEELGKMVDDFNAESDAAYVDGIDVEKWYFAKRSLQILEYKVMWIHPRLTSHEQWQIDHTIQQIHEYLVPHRDAQAAKACSTGLRISDYCTYFRSAQ